MTTRRNFIKNTSAAAATIALIQPLDIFRLIKSKYIGIQLYTVRNELEKDFDATLAKIAEIGYNAVETAGYSDGKFYNKSPVEFKKYMKGYGLKPLSSHANVQLQGLDQMIESHVETGMDYLVKPSINGKRRTSIDAYKKVAEEFNIIGEKCKKSGLRFGYHNHSFEFKKMEGQIPYDVLIENTDPKLVTFEMDTYWVKRGGYEPIDYIKKYPGRFELFHIKDMEKSASNDSTEIGSGVIDFKQIFAESQMSGMKYFFLEQESFKMPVFESLLKSYKYLSSI